MTASGSPPEAVDGPGRGAHTPTPCGGQPTLRHEHTRRTASEPRASGQRSLSPQLAHRPGSPRAARSEGAPGTRGTGAPPPPCAKRQEENRKRRVLRGFASSAAAALQLPRARVHTCAHAHTHPSHAHAHRPMLSPMHTRAHAHAHTHPSHAHAHAHTPTHMHTPLPATVHSDLGLQSSHPHPLASRTLSGP